MSRNDLLTSPSALSFAGVPAIEERVGFPRGRTVRPMTSDPPSSVAFRGHGWLMAGGLVAVVLFGILVGEHIPIRGGRGWDGDIYIAVASDLSSGWERISRDPYRFQRILPCLVVYLGVALSGQTGQDAAALLGFTLLNLVLMLGALWLWLRLAAHWRLSWPARWLGFIGLFVNVPCLKISTYYPGLTDIAALALGMLLVTTLATGARRGLVGAGILGWFTWPASRLMAAFLVLFPHRPEPQEAPSPDPPISPAARWLAGCSALGVVAWMAHLFYGQGIRTAGWGPIVPAVESLYPVSLAVTGLYVYLVVANFTPDPSPSGVRALWTRLEWRWVLLAVAFLVVPRWLVAALTSGVESVTFAKFVPYTFFLSTTRPGIFLVAHVIYFGPVLLLVPLVWSRLRAQLLLWGPGAQLYLIVGLMVAACPDSRQSMLLLPMLVVPTVKALDEQRRISWRLVAGMGSLALVMSRFWLPFNQPTSAPPVDPLHAGWDIGRYYETQGSYMTEPYYVAGAVFCLLLGALLHHWLSPPPSRYGLRAKTRY